MESILCPSTNLINLLNWKATQKSPLISTSSKPNFQKCKACPHSSLPIFRFHSLSRQSNFDSVNSTLLTIPKLKSKDCDVQESGNCSDEEANNSFAESNIQIMLSNCVDSETMKRYNQFFQCWICLFLIFVFTGSEVPSSIDSFQNVPQSISGSDAKERRIQKPKSSQAEKCTRKCVVTCTRGGSGSPGEGPLNIRKSSIVFKEGFHSRQYCLAECSELCNLAGDDTLF